MELTEQFQNFSLSVEAGQVVAIVGASGSGKSTIVQLLTKLYDVEIGEVRLSCHLTFYKSDACIQTIGIAAIVFQVLFDNVNIKEIDLNYLRQEIGVVSQEPILFNTTIEENIRFGNEKVTEKHIWEALKEVNAEDFVKELPQVHLLGTALIWFRV